MKTLIVYATNHGATAECAEKLKNMLDGDVTSIRLKWGAPVENPGSYDRIIIGGSIHAGQLQGRVKKFCRKNMNLLKRKTIGLFLCTGAPPQKATKFLGDNYPGELLQSAKAIGLFGGAFYFERMKFWERMIVKAVANVRETVTMIAEENIKAFAKDMMK
jgi:menaquinone-dependent protoporphyrinogen oxidase